MLHQASSAGGQQPNTRQTANNVASYIILTSYPIDPGHRLLNIVRLEPSQYKPEMRASAAFVAEGDNAGIVINKTGNIMDYNKSQAAQKERHLPPSSKLSFRVSLIHSESGESILEHRTLRFWLDHNLHHQPNDSSNTNSSHVNSNPSNRNNSENYKSTRTFANIHLESSQLAQSYFFQLIGSKPDDFPKKYDQFIMKLMRLLKRDEFSRIIRMEVESRQLACEENAKPASRASSIDGSQSGDSTAGGRGSPLTSQKVLDIIESYYPNPISINEICSSTHTDEAVVRQFVDELANREKINTTDNGQHYTRTTKLIDTKVNLVKQMPNVIKSKQPVIAIITSQYCEKLAVDAMISDKETFVRYRTNAPGSTSCHDSASSEISSANYVYTLGYIGHHRVVSTKLTSIGHTREALIAAGSATTRLLGTFPEIEYVFLVGCAGGVPNYSDFSSHVRLGDIVISHLPQSGNCAELDNHNEIHLDKRRSSILKSTQLWDASGSADYTYIHCENKHLERNTNTNHRIPASFSIHKNLKRAADAQSDVASIIRNDSRACNEDSEETKQIDKEPKESLTSCEFHLWRPAELNLQRLSQSLWAKGLGDPKLRIWERFIDDGIQSLKQQDIDSSRPNTDTNLPIVRGNNTFTVSHPEADNGEVDLRSEGKPMCHFGPIGSFRPASQDYDDIVQQRMISDYCLRSFDSEFDPVVESIHGNCKESYVMIRGISDYKDGRKRNEWQQYASLAAAAFMKSILINLKPLN